MTVVLVPAIIMQLVLMESTHSSVNVNQVLLVIKEIKH